LGGRGTDPDPAGGAYSAPPDHLADGEGAGCPLPKNPTALRLLGLACPTPYFSPPNGNPSYGPALAAGIEGSTDSSFMGSARGIGLERPVLCSSCATNNPEMDMGPFFFTQPNPRC